MYRAFLLVVFIAVELVWYGIDVLWDIRCF